MAAYETASRADLYSQSQIIVHVTLVWGQQMADPCLCRIATGDERLPAKPENTIVSWERPCRYSTFRVDSSRIPAQLVQNRMHCTFRAIAQIAHMMIEHLLKRAHGHTHT
eukprot:scpid112068/ scgid13547/ 